MAEVGTIYLIGAGPGDPELISVKGMRLLSECNAVVFDHLIPDELLIGLPPRRELLYVGKQAGKHTLPQDEINALLVTLAREGKSVARLKGGDPFTFGRGGEEAAYLREHDVKFEVVPGITAGIAAPAYAGIPATDRRRAPFLIFATGHKAEGKESDGIPWETLAQAQGGTLVIYMGVREIGSNVEKLVSLGMAVDTPAAIIRRGTYPSQEVYTGTLSELPMLVEKHEIKPPVVFVIGQVVELRSSLNWLTDKPLLGIRVMVTRAPAQGYTLYRKLRDLGAEVLPYPTITTVENDDPEGWRQFSCISTGHRWLVFTSENGVRYFLRQYIERYGDIRKLADFQIAAIGEGTARALRDNMLRADFVPSEATVAQLGEEFLAEEHLHEAAVVRVRGDMSDSTIEERLKEHQVEFAPITVYRTIHPFWPEGMKEKLFENPPDAVIFTSGSTVMGLYQNLEKNEVGQLFDNCVVASIGPSTSKVIREHGIRVRLEAKVHTVDEVVRMLIEHYKNR